MIPLFKSRVAVFAIGALLVGASVAYAQVWTPPSDNFPRGNVGVPLTVGSSTQWKSGRLYTNQLWISPTSTATFDAMIFPQNKGIGGMIGTTQRTVLYPYAGASWGLYLQSYTAGGGLITLRSGDAGNSMLQLRPDGRIEARGVFVLPTTATATVAATARVPGALVYSRGTAYLYNGTSWNPVGSGVGGGSGGGFWSTTTVPGIIHYSGGNVGIGTSTPTSLLSVSVSNDDAFSLARAGAATPVRFLTGTVGDLVINTNASDTLYMKDGKVSIAGEVGAEKLQVVDGNVSVTADGGTVAYPYDKLPDWFYGANDAWTLYGPIPNVQDWCGCDTVTDSPDDGADETDCAASYNSPNNVGGQCYNRFTFRSGSGLRVPGVYRYDRMSSTAKLANGFIYAQGGIVVGHPNASAAVPFLRLAPAGSAGYSLKNIAGTLMISNGSDINRLTLGQDGALVVSGPSFNINGSGQVMMGATTPPVFMPSARLTVNGAVVITGPSSGPGLAALYVGTSTNGFVQTKDLIAHNNTITTNLQVRASSTGTRGTMILPSGGGPAVQAYMITGGNENCPTSKWGNAICSGYDITCPAGFTARKLAGGAYKNVCTYP